jgi:integrase
VLAALADRRNQRSANIIRLALFTGARRGEVLKATWDQFDLAAGVWTKLAPRTKQRKLHRVPLSAPARQVLADMRATSTSTGPLFPAPDGDGTQGDVKKAWQGVCEAAGITGLRFHDLRHSFASSLAGSGHSLPIIGKMLGHSSTATTQRYAHLLDDPLRAAADTVGRIHTAASGRGEGIAPDAGAEVHPLRSRRK